MRLIDADALKAFYKHWDSEYSGEELKRYKEIFDSIVDQQPTVEAVPIVRCGECKNFVESDRSHPDCDFCKRRCWFGIIGKNDYCSKGERKEKESGTTERQDSNL